MGKSPAGNAAEEKIFGASVRDFFATDMHSRVFRSAKKLSIDETKEIVIEKKNTFQKWEINFERKIYFDYEANAVYTHFYIPKINWQINLVGIFKTLIRNYSEDPLIDAPPAMRENSINMRDNPSDRFHFSRQMVNTRLIVFYVDALLTNLQKTEIYKFADARGLIVKIRDRQYARLNSMKEKPLAFISHDSRDKAAIARPLAEALTAKIGRVWFDQYSLRLGASLRESIEEGIKECRRCVLIISPHFIENKGWTKTEFNAIFSREMIENKNVIIPVWANVTKQQVYEYSPILVDKLAVDWSEGVDIVSEKIKEEISLSR